ncbi:hypothetical protein [Opitutus terrae]|uniref:Uncharacterized protein n=1 Tax=Opitutus terrae (strain DSM 11246 / JCM 15787 / PB90-1) TaxID=452637 RepID=B1ZPX4_OPITP|nr:hypothetical protein [Opitutus terrae]ACB77695.1 hypothetical protein Oter_4424 [Opitutus terrae PB90-1]
MKTTTTLSRFLGLGSLLAFSIGAAAPQIHAGSKPATVCTDPETVAVTEMRQDWPSHKGPLRFVQTGTKQVCNSCDGSFTVMKPSLPNGRGPLQQVRIAAQHNCDSSCVMRPRA